MLHRITIVGSRDILSRPSYTLLAFNVTILFGLGTSAKLTASAWVSRAIQHSTGRYHGLANLNLLRGGTEDSTPLSNIEPFRRTSSYKNSITRNHMTSLPADNESVDFATLLGGSNLTKKAASDFGGLKYWNTNVDERFRVLFVLGGPGAGKGTQSELMEENYPVAHFSVGELLRNIPKDSPHKATIEKSLVAGQIVPVEISLALLRSAMEKATEKVGKHALFLVDGFPRNFDNLSGWCTVMQDVAALEAVLVYQCPLPVLQERILERAKTSGRDDDNLASVKKRFDTFEGQTVPVVDTLRSAANGQQRWSVVDISGDQPLKEVWVSTQQVLNKLILHDVLSANAALLSAIQDGDAKAYEKLCDAEFFSSGAADTILTKQEGSNDTAIQCAQVDIITGRQVAVSYDRVVDDVPVREKRFWSHQGADGWRNVHFSRIPCQK